MKHFSLNMKDVILEAKGEKQLKKKAINASSKNTNKMNK